MYMRGKRNMEIRIGTVGETEEEGKKTRKKEKNGNGAVGRTNGKKGLGKE